MNSQRIASIVSLAAGLSALIAANYSEQLRGFVAAHPSLTTIIGGLIMILNNVLPPAHKP